MFFQTRESYLHLFLLMLMLNVSLNSEFLPQFDEPDTETVTVTEGDTAVITCNIGYLNNQ